jgi:hypothetical protein
LYNDLLTGTAWPVLPYCVHKVLVDRFVFTALLLDLISELPCIACCHYAGVNGNDFASLHAVYSPFLDSRYILNALLEQLPVAVQLLLSLVEVSSVGR